MAVKALILGTDDLYPQLKKFMNKKFSAAIWKLSATQF